MGFVALNGAVKPVLVGASHISPVCYHIVIVVLYMSYLCVCDWQYNTALANYIISLNNNHNNNNNNNISLTPRSHSVSPTHNLVPSSPENTFMNTLMNTLTGNKFEWLKEEREGVGGVFESFAL